ncbi:hypothetical protein D3C84_1313890 [compost metagenome]
MTILLVEHDEGIGSLGDVRIVEHGLNDTTFYLISAWSRRIDSLQICSIPLDSQRLGRTVAVG